MEIKNNIINGEKPSAPAPTPTPPSSGCGCLFGQMPSMGKSSENNKPSSGKCVQRLGYAYVPVQQMNEVYPPEKALERGTMFPELDLPFGMYGAEVG